MKLVILEGCLYVVIGVGTVLVSDLADFAEKGTWPSGIKLVVIAITALVAGATQLKAFTSASLHRELSKREDQDEK